MPHRRYVQRHLFARRRRQNHTGCISQFRTRFPNAPAVRHKFCNQQHRLTDRNFADKPDIQFRRETKPFLPARRYPKHRFVECRRNNSAVNEVAKTGVLRRRCKICVHFVADLPEA